MKIVAISDIHGNLLKANYLPSGDILCICGDIMPLSIQRYQYQSTFWMQNEFQKWIQSLPYKHIVIVPGNHDFIFGFLYKIKSIDEINTHLNLPSNVHLLIDSECNIDGYTFWGSPWCPDLKKWAFYADHNTLIEKFNKIPNNVDVLLTHCPPKINDYGRVLEQGFNYLKNFGCQELADIVEEKKPKLHIFGHVHSGSHEIQNVGETKFCNVSILSELYTVTYKPTIINL